MVTKPVPVRLPPATLAWLRERVDAGEFASVAEGIRYALKKLMDEHRQTWHEEQTQDSYGQEITKL